MHDIVGLFHRLCPSLADHADHTVDRCGMRVLGGKGEGGDSSATCIPADIFPAPPQSLPPARVGIAAVVAACRQDLRRHGIENKGHAEENEVDCVSLMMDHGINPEQNGSDRQQEDRQGGVAVPGIHAVSDAFFLCSDGEKSRDLRFPLQIGLCPPELFNALLRLRSQVLHIPGLFPGPFLFHPGLGLLTHRRDLRVPGPDDGQEAVNILLVLEITLAFSSILQEHHQVGNGAKDALSRESAPGHSYTLEDPPDILPHDIIPAVDEKAVQIDRLLSDPAWSGPDAVFDVTAQVLHSHFVFRDRHWCKNHILFRRCRGGSFHSFQPMPLVRAAPFTVFAEANTMKDRRRFGPLAAQISCLKI